MNNNSTKLVPVIHLKEWVIANIISYIPVIGLTMLFIWAFGSSTVNENKKNWAKALLLIQLILQRTNLASVILQTKSLKPA